jgi:hypothetical protein
LHCDKEIEMHGNKMIISNNPASGFRITHHFKQRKPQQACLYDIQARLIASGKQEWQNVGIKS